VHRPAGSAGCITRLAVAKCVKLNYILTTCMPELPRRTFPFTYFRTPNRELLYPHYPPNIFSSSIFQTGDPPSEISRPTFYLIGTTKGLKSLWAALACSLIFRNIDDRLKKSAFFQPLPSWGTLWGWKEALFLTIVDIPKNERAGQGYPFRF